MTSQSHLRPGGSTVRRRLIGALHDLDRRTPRPLTKEEIADEALRVIVDVLRDHPTPCEIDLFGAAISLIQGSEAIGG